MPNPFKRKSSKPTPPPKDDSKLQSTSEAGSSRAATLTASALLAVGASGIPPAPVDRQSVLPLAATQQRAASPSSEEKDDVDQDPSDSNWPLTGPESKPAPSLASDAGRSGSNAESEILYILLGPGEQWKRPKTSRTVRPTVSEQYQLYEAAKLDCPGYWNVIDYENRQEFHRRIWQLAKNREVYISKAVTDLIYNQWAAKKENEPFLPDFENAVAPVPFLDKRPAGPETRNGHFVVPKEWDQRTRGYIQDLATEATERHVYAMCVAKHDRDVLPFEHLSQFLRRQRIIRRPPEYSDDLTLRSTYSAWLADAETRSLVNPL
jgi:hypothetical protein